jgi:putative Mn2+ efflux pump MntP
VLLSRRNRFILFLMETLPTVTLFVFNAVTAFVFAVIYLRGALNRRVPAISFLFVLICLAMGITGWLAGDAVAGHLGEFAITTGGALAMVTGLKRIIKGWRTRITERLYDITRPRSLPALILAMNIDTLLLTLSLSMISSVQLENSMTWLVVSSAAGILLARMAQTRTPLILANVAEIIAGVALLVAGAIALF